MTVLGWQIVDAIAGGVSAAAILAGTIFVVFQMRQAARDRYVAITSHLFEIWQSADFQKDQLFLLHQLSATSWEEFIAAGRGTEAERAFHRVGGFYDRVGHLVLNRMIKQEDILPTIGGDAIAVWQKIEPLVRAARRVENRFLFQSYEAVLPQCLECYTQPVAPVAGELGAEVPRIEAKELFDLLKGGAVAVLDVSKADSDKRIKGALRAEPNNLVGWIHAIAPGKPLVLYCT